MASEIPVIQCGSYDSWKQRCLLESRHALLYRWLDLYR